VDVVNISFLVLQFRFVSVHVLILMIFCLTLQRSNCNNLIRGLSTDAVTTTSGGVFTGLFQRISSFLVGVGMTAVGTQYYLYEEIKKSNAGMISKQKDIEKRLDKLEKK
jgi:hypothetical protein